MVKMKESTEWGKAPGQKGIVKESEGELQTEELEWQAARLIYLILRARACRSGQDPSRASGHRWTAITEAWLYRLIVVASTGSEAMFQTVGGRYGPERGGKQS